MIYIKHCNVRRLLLVWAVGFFELKRFFLGCVYAFLTFSLISDLCIERKCTVDLKGSGGYHVTILSIVYFQQKVSRVSPA